MIPGPVNRIVLQQMPVLLGCGEIVDSHQLELRVVPKQARRNPADATKAVNPTLIFSVIR